MKRDKRDKKLVDLNQWYIFSSPFPLSPSFSPFSLPLSPSFSPFSLSPSFSTFSLSPSFSPFSLPPFSFSHLSLPPFSFPLVLPSSSNCSISSISLSYQAAPLLGRRTSTPSMIIYHSTFLFDNYTFQRRETNVFLFNQNIIIII